MVLKGLIFFVLIAGVFNYPSEQNAGCGCCCGCQPAQEDPTTSTTMATTTTTTEPPMVVEVAQSQSTACGCCCCGTQSIQEDPTTTTTTTEAPTTTEVVQADPQPCCCCCAEEVQYDPTTTTTMATTTTTQVYRRVRVGCCGCVVRQAVQAEELGYAENPAPVPIGYEEPVNQLPYDQSQKTCPEGFQQIDGSCFYIETDKLSYDQAEMRCKQKGATMFAPSSKAVWDEVMAMTPPYFWTWTGITQDTSADVPHFQEAVAMDTSAVNWLIRPFSSVSNGWSTVSTCAAFYNIEMSSSNYVYFYPCSLQYHSICQVNLVEPQPQPQAQPFRRWRFKHRRH
uniref:C-type lectin domain-containing protein n=1 Tax=Haemonchus contortus TaxID=6289 RepID=A0A7I5E7A1_HAECO